MEDKKHPSVQYFIGVDSHSENVSSFCLIRKIGEVREVILSKLTNDKEQFEKDVKNLSDLFQAKIIEEQN